MSLRRARDRTRCLSLPSTMRNRWFRISLRIVTGWQTLSSICSRAEEPRCLTRQPLERLRGGVHPKEALIVVSDSEDNSSELSFKELSEVAEEQDGLIYVIGLFD